MSKESYGVWCFLVLVISPDGGLYSNKCNQEKEL